MYGEITGQIAVGRYVLQIGDPGGAVVREASRTERAHVRPRPTPIYRRPKLIRGFLGRRTELQAALSALDAGLPIEVSGASGIGKTAFLRHLAAHPRAASFVDGIVYMSARHLSSDDLLQLLFEAFNESDEACKPTDAEIRRGLQEKQALILLDDVHLKQDELERVLDAAPRSAFSLATRERCLWGEVRSLVLKGLSVEDAVLLLEREIERPLDVTERSAAETFCEAIAGHPRRILQAAAIVRERGVPMDGWIPDAAAEELITELVAAVDEKQRRILLALTALPGVPLQVPHVSGIAEVMDAEAALMALVRCGLVAASQSRYHLADGVADRLRRTDDLNRWRNRAITYFTSWAERHRRSADILLAESEALLCVQRAAADTRRWGEVLLLGRHFEGALVMGARWGAWAVALELCLSAARATGDRAAEGWALHEIGSRALCAGNSGQARATLGQAVRLRGALQDGAAATASGRNLRLVLSPISDEPREPSTVIRPAARASDSLPLRDVAQPATHAPKASRAGVLALTAALSAIVGWFGYWTLAAVLPGGRTPRDLQPHAANPAAQRSQAAPQPPAEDPRTPRLYSDIVLTAADTPATPPPEQAVAAEGPTIRIFTARPGSVATSGHAGLCYAVDGASRARIDPGVGAVSPASTLTCLRVAPRRTSTYELIASSPDGHQARQQLVIFVK